MKYKILLGLFLSTAVVRIYAQCPPGFVPGNLVVTPSKTWYCKGDDVTSQFNQSQSITDEHWTFTGSANQTVGVGTTMNINDLMSGGVVTFTALYIYNGQECPFTTNVTLNMSNVQVTAPSPVNLVPMSPFALSCTPSNGVSPYTYNWQPNNFFTSSTTNTHQNPVVATPVSLVYTVTVTDNAGCVASTMVDVVAHPYAHTLKVPDGGYYKLFSNQLLFKYEGQYATYAIRYNVYDKNNAVVASNTSGSLLGPATSVKSGDNRYFLNASSFSAGYYTLELINEKNEKEYIRFKK